MADASDDRTARARIRDAAIEQFSLQGVDGTSLKTIAAEAGVSPALVVHHFGSKNGLREACDEHVAATVRAGKFQAMSEGPQLDPLAALRQAADSAPLLRYLARTVGDSSPQVAAIIDEMVEDAEAYMEEGVRSGLLTASENPRARAVVLTIWSLGALTLHEHLHRLLGVDLTSDDAAAMAGYALPATEILAGGMLDEGLHKRMRDALAEESAEGS